MDGGQSHSRIVLQKSLLLPEEYRKKLAMHANRWFPNESCALLFGTEIDDMFRVQGVFLTENSEGSTTRFTISNEELLRGYQEAEKNRLDVIGIFHSHPHSEAIPSSTDTVFMEINPVVWVIFSNKDQSFGAYIVDSDKIPRKVRLV